MICPRCKSQNISTHKKWGIKKLLQYLNPTIAHRCIGCGFNFYRFNKSFLISLIIILAVTGGGGWILLEKLTMPQPKAAPVHKSVSNATPPKGQPSDTKAEVVKAIPAMPKKAVPQHKPGGTKPVKTPETSTQKPVAAAGKPVKTPETSTQKPVAAAEKPVKTPETSTQKPVAAAEKPVKTPETSTQKPVAVQTWEQAAGTVRQMEAQTSPVKASAQTFATVDTGKKTVTSGAVDTQALSQPTGLKKLKKITVQVVNGDNQILIQANQPVLEYKYFFLDYPPRMVIDLLGNWEKPKTLSQNTHNAFITQIRLWKHEDKLRLTSDLKTNKPVYPIFKKTDKGLLVILQY